MDTFDSLKDGNIEEQSIHTIFMTLLDRLFGEARYVIDRNIEVDEKHQIILDNWSILSKTFHLDSKLKFKKKLVRQTLKTIIDHINDKYKFNSPILFDTKATSIQQDGKTTTINQAIVTLS